MGQLSTSRSTGPARPSADHASEDQMISPPAPPMIHIGQQSCSVNPWAFLFCHRRYLHDVRSKFWGHCEMRGHGMVSLTAFLLPLAHLVLKIQHWGLVWGVIGIAFTEGGRGMTCRAKVAEEILLKSEHGPHFPLLFWLREAQVLWKQWGWRNTSNSACGWKLHE